MANFKLGEMIGRGGMGTVYRAHHEELDKDVAVKFIHEHLAQDDEIVQRFLREARLVAKIDHPNVVRVFDMGTDDTGRPYIVMELLDGESLRNRLKRGAIPEQEALEITLQVLGALGKAHEAGVVHRDIKPGNIFLCSNGTVKLVDFGIAKALGGEQLTSTGTMIGTPEYMSPEQAEGRPVDARSDLYSLGIVAYEMLAGEVPFKADTPASVLHMQVYSPAPKLPQESGALPPVIRAALAKNPDNRPQSAEEMAAALQTPSSAAATRLAEGVSRDEQDTRAASHTVASDRRRGRPALVTGIVAACVTIPLVLLIGWLATGRFAMLDSGGRITFFQGRPGWNVLWFPVKGKGTDLVAKDFPPAVQSQLRTGLAVPSDLKAAKDFLYVRMTPAAKARARGSMGGTAERGSQGTRSPAEIAADKRDILAVLVSQLDKEMAGGGRTWNEAPRELPAQATADDRQWRPAIPSGEEVAEYATFYTIRVNGSVALASLHYLGSYTGGGAFTALVRLERQVGRWKVVDRKPGTDEEAILATYKSDRQYLKLEWRKAPQPLPASNVKSARTWLKQIPQSDHTYWYTARISGSRAAVSVLYVGAANSGEAWGFVDHFSKRNGRWHRGKEDVVFQGD